MISLAVALVSIAIQAKREMEPEKERESQLKLQLNNLKFRCSKAEVRKRPTGSGELIPSELYGFGMIDRSREFSTVMFRKRAVTSLVIQQDLIFAMK